jgi:hypothetical protein
MATAGAEAEEAGSEEARGAELEPQGTLMTPPASPGSEDRAEVGDGSLGPALEGLPTDVSPPDPPSDGATEPADRAEGEELPRRSLRPRNAAGSVVYPPKDPPRQVFRKGGGRK